jgi:hypothetical protein
MSLIHSMLMSLHGYVEDERGPFGWGAPSASVIYRSNGAVPVTRAKNSHTHSGFTNSVRCVLQPHRPRPHSFCLERRNHRSSSLPYV